MRFSVSRSLKLISMSSSIAKVEIARMSALSQEAVVQLILAVPSTGSLLPSATFRMGLSNLFHKILFLFTKSCLMRDVLQPVSGVPFTLATFLPFWASHMLRSGASVSLSLAWET